MLDGSCSVCGGRLGSGAPVLRPQRHNWTSKTSPSLVCRPARQGLVVEAKKVLKKQQVVLGADIVGLGKAGTMTMVPNGYFRNYLRPRSLAFPATTTYLKRLEQERLEKEHAYKVQVAKAKAMATALSTIGKFEVFKKVGENKRIYGSVTAQEIVDAIARQTNKTLPKEAFTIPEIKETGTYTASVKLHKEVTGNFKILVTKAKQS